MYTVHSPCSRCASLPAPVRRRVHGPSPSPSSAASSTCTPTETRCTSCCIILVVHHAMVLLEIEDPRANCYMWFYEYAALHHLRSDTYVATSFSSSFSTLVFHPRFSPSSVIGTPRSPRRMVVLCPNPIQLSTSISTTR